MNRNQVGNYTCFASNVEGDNESNALELRVMCKYTSSPSLITVGILIINRQIELSVPSSMEPE